MRKLLLAGLLAFGALLPSPAALAYEGPWCAIVDQGAGFIEELCSMRSYEMCRAEARRWGPTAHCRQNGRYPGYWASHQGPPPRKRMKRPRRH
jgi:hypothetical protein